MYHSKEDYIAEQAAVILRFSLSAKRFDILLPAPQNKASQF